VGDGFGLLAERSCRRTAISTLMNFSKMAMR
jgi:hypothetical protein